MRVQDAIRVAEAVRAACIAAAERAYEDGGMSGLCADGRWELAVGAIRELDLQQLLPPPRGNSRGGAVAFSRGCDQTRKA